MTASTPSRSGAPTPTNVVRESAMADTGLVTAITDDDVLLASEELVPMGALALPAVMPSCSGSSSTRGSAWQASLLTFTLVATSGSLVWLHMGTGTEPRHDRSDVAAAVATKPDRLMRERAESTSRRVPRASREAGHRRAPAARHARVRPQRAAAPGRRPTRAPAHPAQALASAARVERSPVSPPSCEFEPSCSGAGEGL